MNIHILSNYLLQVPEPIQNIVLEYLKLPEYNLYSKEKYGKIYTTLFTGNGELYLAVYSGDKKLRHDMYLEGNCYDKDDRNGQAFFITYFTFLSDKTCEIRSMSSLSVLQSQNAFCAPNFTQDTFYRIKKKFYYNIVKEMLEDLLKEKFS